MLLQAWQPDTWGLHMWNTQFWLVIEMSNMDFFKVVIFILRQVLSYYYTTLLRLGGYKWYAYKGGTFSSSMLATIMTRCYQYLQTGYFGNDKPASFTSSSWLIIRWVFHDQCFFCEKSMSVNWLWRWPIDPDFLEEGNTKELRMIRCRLTRIFNPEHNLSNLFLCLCCRSV